MYLALFLAPWVLMYAASTFAMNHRTWFRGESGRPPQFVQERQFTYEGVFPENATPRDIGRQLLVSLDIDGAFQANRRGNDGTIVVTRHDARRPVRVTYVPAGKQVTVERQQFEALAFLERFHRRRGFQQGYLLHNLWGVSVDLFVAAVLFWGLSGLWLWWELKVTRGFGLAFLLAGVGLFAFFLAVL